MWNLDNNINLVADCKKLMAWLEKTVTFIYRRRNQSIIIVGCIALIAFIWTRNVYYASLLLAIALAVVFLSRKHIFSFCSRLIAKPRRNIAEPLRKMTKCFVRAITNPTLQGFALSVIIALGGFYIAADTVKKQFTAQSEILKTQSAAEHFKNAIEHLGSEQQPIVLGGVHALHNLAVKNQEYRQPVFEILCSFIRQETVKEEYQARVEATNAPSIVIQTIVDKLFRYKTPDKKVYRDHKTEHQYQANLTGAFLRGVNLRYANLQRADLRKTDLQGADLIHADLQGADLSHADLRAELRNANLQRAELRNANLQGADLWKANLQGAKLWDADIREVKYAGFTGAEGVEPGEDGEWRTLPYPYPDD